MGQLRERLRASFRRLCHDLIHNREMHYDYQDHPYTPRSDFYDSIDGYLQQLPHVRRRANTVLAGDCIMSDAGIYMPGAEIASAGSHRLQASELSYRLLDAIAYAQPSTVVFHIAYPDAWRQTPLAEYEAAVIYLMVRARSIPTVRRVVWIEPIPMGPSNRVENAYIFNARKRVSDAVHRHSDLVIPANEFMDVDGYRKEQFCRRDGITMTGAGYRTLRRVLSDCLAA